MTSASLPMDKAAKTAYKDAAIEVAKGIAMGAVPILGQAIDAYDTIESCIVLYNAETPDAKEQAEFDLVLALIGWIPGPGDGVKRSFRLVNREPERYAPVLFDLCDLSCPNVESRPVLRRCCRRFLMPVL